jgi:hypothetical protein
MRVSLLAASLLTAAACPAPGEGAQAERGYKAAAPIIAALDRFHADSGHVPATLTALVPAFLADSTLAALPRQQEPRPWSYTVSGDDYTLAFRYSGPGTNECSYRHSTSHWHCSGAY